MAQENRPIAEQTFTILVVEDDLAVASLVQTLLNREAGWGATVVHDAAAAAEVFRHVEVDILVVDVNLPGISGVELLDVLRKDTHWRQPPVILMSSHPGQPLVQDALTQDQSIRFIAKPFDVDDLVVVVGAAADLPRAAATSRECAVATAAGVVSHERKRPPCQFLATAH